MSVYSIALSWCAQRRWEPGAPPAKAVLLAQGLWLLCLELKTVFVRSSVSSSQSHQCSGHICVCQENGEQNGKRNSKNSACLQVDLLRSGCLWTKPLHVKWGSSVSSWVLRRRRRMLEMCRRCLHFCVLGAGLEQALIIATDLSLLPVSR